MTAPDGYAAAVERVALLAEPGRRVVEVTGSQALRVVEGLASNSVDGVPGGDGVYSFLLEPKGRVVVDLRVLPGPGFDDGSADGGGAEALWLDIPAEGLDALRAHLGKYVPPIFAACRPLDVRVVSLLGPAAAGCMERFVSSAGLRASRSPAALGPLQAATVAGDALSEPGLIVRREEIEVPGLDFYAGAGASAALADEMVAAVEALGGAPAAPSDWDALRIERGLPIYGKELGPDRLAQEAGQDERAISFTKGCFTGQEVVARIHYRGHVNRHLRGIRPTLRSGPARDGEDVDFGVEVGATLEHGGRTVGAVTSVTRSPRLGPIGLAYVRREVEPGTRVTSPEVPDRALEVARLPFT